MKRSLVIFATLALLALPVIVGAQETVIAPEANWTPTPPARPSVDLGQLVQLLQAKGVITDQDYARLTQSRLSSPSQQGNGRVRTWDEIDAYRRSPVNSGTQGN
jgi:hypothetical protein